jgi:hypothetical protein
MAVPKRAQRVERSLAAPLQLLVHVLPDQVHRNVTRPFVHDLDLMLPRDPGEFALGTKLRKLRFVIRIGDGAGAEPVTQRE